VRALVHLGGAEQRLEATVKEREAAVGHLELGRRRKLLVELLCGSGGLVGERRDRCDHEIDEARQPRRAQQLDDALAREVLHVVELRRRVDAELR